MDHQSLFLIVMELLQVGLHSVDYLFSMICMAWEIFHLIEDICYFLHLELFDLKESPNDKLIDMTREFLMTKHLHYNLLQEVMSLELCDWIQIDSQYNFK